MFCTVGVCHCPFKSCMLHFIFSLFTVRAASVLTKLWHVRALSRFSFACCRGQFVLSAAVLIYTHNDVYCCYFASRNSRLIIIIIIIIIITHISMPNTGKRTVYKKTWQSECTATLQHMQGNRGTTGQKTLVWTCAKISRNKSRR
jgi:hypothetical protein